MGEVKSRDVESVRGLCQANRLAFLRRDEPIRRVEDRFTMVFDPSACSAKVPLLDFDDCAVRGGSEVEQELAVLGYDVD